MSRTRINSIFLPGWEYNRVLSDSVLEPRNSALAGSVFSNGGAQFWLFEHVYCTKESLDNERAANIMLGWTTGKAFGDLEDDGILKTVDWSALNPQVKHEVDQALTKTTENLTPDQVRGLITSGQAHELAGIRSALLKPIAAHHSCILNYDTTTIPHWKLSDGAAITDKDIALMRLAHSSSERLGIKLIPHISQIELSASERSELGRIVSEVESDLIDDLICGDGENKGPEGYVPYLTRLQEHRSGYEPIDTQTIRFWDGSSKYNIESNRKRLIELRRIAKEYLWPKLHEDLIPRLENDQISPQEFSDRVTHVLTDPRFSQFLNMNSSLIFGVGFLTAFQLFSKLAASIEPALAEQSLVGALEAASASKVGLLISSRHKQLKEDYGAFSLFYQRAKSL